MIRCDRSDTLELSGVDNTSVYMMPCKLIAAVVSDVEREDFKNDISALARHESVIESLMESYSLLPARFGTVLQGDEHVMELLSSSYEQYSQGLQKVENRVEFDLKVFWPAGELRSLIEQTDPYRTAFAELERKSGPSARYVLYKQRETVVTRILKTKAEEQVSEIQRSLVPVCAQCRCEVMPSEGLMLDGAYLIERVRCGEFRDIIESMQSSNVKFCFLLTGPWPPYNFMSLGNAMLKCVETT